MDPGLSGGDDPDLSDLGAGDRVPATGGRLAPGTALAGGRLQLTGLIGRTLFGEVYHAQDRSTGQPVALRLIAAELASDGTAPARLDQVAQALAKMDHKNVARAFEAGHEAGMLWMLTELIDGETLRSLLLRKQKAGGAAFSLKGAYNVVAHVCNGLVYAHQGTWHGALSASNVLVNKAGRVKITEFGLARAFPSFCTAASSSPYASDLAAVAPEVKKAPASVDNRADVYSVGAILYELLTGREPGGQLVRPSTVQAGLGAEIDQLVSRCLAPNPADRFADMGQVKASLASLVERAGAAASQAPRGSAPPRGAPAVAARATPARPQAAVAAPGPSLPPGPARPRVSAAGSAALDESEERWLIQKNKMDFGPFSFADIKKQIAADQIEPGHVIMDNESGQRCKVEDHPLLHDLVLGAAQRRDDHRRANAEAHVVKSDKRKGLTLYAVIAVGVLALVGGGYFVVKAVRGGAAKKDRGELASLSSAEIPPPTIKLLERPKRPPRDPNRKPGTPRAPRPAGSPGGGFDDALDLGSAEDGEESESLSNSQINPVIQRNGTSLSRCLMSQGERRANIEFIVLGSGKVSAVRVNGSESSGLARCISGAMRGWQFPSFNGPRTRASFDMSI